METKNSKITQISGNGTWETPDGKTLYKFEIATELGHSGMVFKQSQDSGLAIGQELEYYLDPKGQLKIPKKPYTGNLSNNKPSYNDKGVQEKIIRQSCLKSSCSFHSQSSASVEDVLKTADKFIAWVNKETIDEQKQDLPF